ncbi:putative integrase/recombinase protein [Cupriavidus taiwanensis]|uniref:tyrosine-type recombinase/integrase n=1 Tax=Cupriavidus taiwanensis TaxID=164546 RepID=UPI000E129F3B|nr:tyrosine-type recombinase/integrase [Cupriavidus taiwanensis]SOZ19065.1 putative integrase/recombinase protein [Cupriavidus taiwanensis]SOZ32216.1 putative integrase/recombinase protein [Cupriavidus taiwanensis]SOZ47815.1 putative integrase/recombinase protein [Cupriavidus taiwanensis]SPA02758.1 putative integrase/recombinase protein [Cupriavidus taiwanensis]
MTTKPSAAQLEQAALFDADLAAWRDHPERAFDGWLAQHGFRHGTSVVYRAMWGKLLRWSAERGLPPLSWSAEQIGEFLDAQQLHKSHRYRYARLIERVFHHLSRLREGMHNPGSQAVRAHLAEGENDPTAFLLPGERDLLVARILGPAGAPADTGATASPTQWKRARDAALLAVLLGGGLKVAEARALRIDVIADMVDSRPGRMALRMVRPDNGRAYTVPLFPLAHAPLRAWLALREASGTLGSLVFPAMPTGRPMHAASVYRRVEILLDEAGVLAGRSERASPQTLRNTCAAMHFEAGTAPAEVAQCLGMRDLESGWRLRAAYEAWQARAGLVAPASAASD